ncbi:hypothetical protein MesoLj131a_60790 [Mesorhizobium sp. 131-2-1]|nr:hypothetical protein MesoLj131a_60790 [Mesorhizobium sp. 131-2-1]
MICACGCVVGKIIVPPVANGTKNSGIETSNAGRVSCEMLVPSEKSIISIYQSTRFRRAAWETGTPLGIPVLPEVCMMYAMFEKAE